MRCILMKLFIISHFSYRLLIWMTHRQGFSSKVNDIYERALSIVNRDFSTSLEDLLVKVCNNS